MPISYSIDQERGLVLTRVTGELDVAMTEEYFGALQQDARCPAGAIEIVDFSDVTDFAIRYGEMIRIANAYQGTKLTRKIRATVFHCPSDLSYGIARMLQTFHEVANPGHVVTVTRSREELDACIADLRADQADPGDPR